VGASVKKFSISKQWMKLSPSMLPFADAATDELPLSRLLRLSLFQVSVGMAAVLLIGTLNRVMIVELQMSAALVAIMVALPLIFAPLRALIGFKSDNYASALGWRRSWPAAGLRQVTASRVTPSMPDCAAASSMGSQKRAGMPSRFQA